VIALALMWLRAAGLVGQAAALGCAVFALVVLGPERALHSTRALHRALALGLCGALLAAVAQAGVLAMLVLAFADGAGSPLLAVLGSTVGIVGIMRIALATTGAVAAHALCRAPNSIGLSALLLVATVLLSVTGALSGHAAGRVEGRAWLALLSSLHQGAAGIWAGGLIGATLLWLDSGADVPDVSLRRFSRLAVLAVTALALTGAGLAAEYIATPAAAIGTSYGAMTLTKIVLFAAMLVMGVLNHRALNDGLPLVSWRQCRSAVAPSGAERSTSIVFRRRVEVEAGLALVTLFLAASIGSAPPAADVSARAATVDEIRGVFTPQWPRLQAPSLAELAAASALGDPAAPHSPEETAWSEFGHHVAGLFIVAMGALAMLERTGWAHWARHWPLLFVGLTAFVAWSLDPEGWQTGTVGFWEQLSSLEVLQHRILLALTALLGVAEWRVHSGGRPTSVWRYVFPLVCIASGILLLSHGHDVNNAKSAFLLELTHLPLGLVIPVAGWARWLELRLAPPAGRSAGRLWAPAFTLFGLLLLLHREM